MFLPAASYRPTALSLCALLALAGLSVACQKPAPEPPSAPASTRVESLELGLALANVPEGFKVLDSASLRLGRTDDQTGELWVEVGPSTPTGINMVQVVRDWEDQYKAMPEGQFLGQLELGSQFGTTFTVRGRYSKDGLTMEERRIFTVYPGGDRLVTMVYSYPAGEDTKVRSDQMFAVFGELEPLATAAAPEESPEQSPEQS